MKLSVWLRQYQLTGEVPTLKESEHATEISFWAGWMIGPHHSLTAVTFDERREMAIKAAEFIEAQT